MDSGETLKLYEEAAQDFAKTISRKRSADPDVWWQNVYANIARSNVGDAYVVSINANGHVERFEIDGRAMRTQKPWLVYQSMESQIERVAARLFAKPRGCLDYAEVRRWLQIPELMCEQKWVDAWHLARDCMVGLAEMVCMAHDINPDQLIEWERRAK